MNCWPESFYRLGKAEEVFIDSEGQTKLECLEDVKDELQGRKSPKKGWGPDGLESLFKQSEGQEACIDALGPREYP